MRLEGPGPAGPGPSASAIEAARLRVYRPDASDDDRAEYRRLLDDERRSAPEVRGDVPAEEDSVPPAPLATGSRRRRRVAVAVFVVIAVTGLLVAVLLPQRDPTLPDQLGAPSSPGRTLTILFRTSDPRTAADVVTYQPEGYTVFQPTARTLHVAIRCQGAGRVVVLVGARFTFRCTDRRAVLRQTGEATGRPFVAGGITRGNVVWSARVTVD